MINDEQIENEYYYQYDVSNSFVKVVELSTPKVSSNSRGWEDELSIIILLLKLTSVKGVATSMCRFFLLQRTLEFDLLCDGSPR